MMSTRGPSLSILSPDTDPLSMLGINKNSLLQLCSLVVSHSQTAFLSFVCGWGKEGPVNIERLHIHSNRK